MNNNGQNGNGSAVITQNTAKRVIGRPFKPGNIGKPVGTKNHLTKSARDAFQYAFEKIGGAKALAVWAESNQDEFYKLFARLIPVDVTSGGAPIQLVSITIVQSESVPQLPAISEN